MKHFISRLRQQGMKTIGLILAAISLAGCAAAQRKIEEVRGERTGALHQDPDGFQVSIPSGWSVQKLGSGQVAVVSSDRKSYVVVAPVVGELSDCGSLLRYTMSSGWAAFPSAAQVKVSEQGRGSAMANFAMHDGQIRGAVMCAAASARSAMLFGMAAPAAEFDSSKAMLVAVLRSFAYGSATKPPGPATAAEPQMESWRDPTESAFTVLKPAGWQAQGGVARLSNMDVRVAFRFVSPDNSSAIWVGDTRLGSCKVPGPSAPNTQGMAGWCPYRTGTQIAQQYVSSILGRDLGVQGLQVTGGRDRTDLTAQADRLPRMAGMNGVRNAYGEVEIAGSRGGAPVVGRVAGNTQFMASVAPDLVAGSYSQEISGYLAPQGKESEIAAIMGRVLGSMQWNSQWIMANRQAASQDAQATMNYLRGQAELSQQMFEQRMDSADRRAAAVGDVLSGTVRLQDQQGNRYQAKAGSNYYYLNEQQAAQQSDPNRAVLGTDQWAPLHGGAIDLRPLELVR
ncbi:MAG: hypothetical protein ABI972_11720 [Acidobacteriota bacterium]